MLPSSLQPPTVRATKRRESRPKKTVTETSAFKPAGYVHRDSSRARADCSPVSPIIRSNRPRNYLPSIPPSHCPLPSLALSSSCLESSSSNGSSSSSSYSGNIPNSSNFSSPDSSDGDTSSDQRGQQRLRPVHPPRQCQRTTRTVISPVAGSNIHLCPPLPGPLFLQMDMDTKTPLLGVRMPLGSVKPVSSPRIPPRVQWTSSSGSRAGDAAPSSSGSSSVLATDTPDTVDRSKAPPRTATATRLAPQRTAVTVTPPSPISCSPSASDRSSKAPSSPGEPVAVPSEERMAPPPPLVSVEAYFPPAPPNRRVRFLHRQLQQQQQQRHEEEEECREPSSSKPAPVEACSPPVDTDGVVEQAPSGNQKMANRLTDRGPIIQGEGEEKQQETKRKASSTETPNGSRRKPTIVAVIKPVDEEAACAEAGKAPSPKTQPAPAAAADTSLEIVASPAPPPTAVIAAAAKPSPSPIPNKVVGESGRQKLLGSLASASKLETAASPEKLKVIVAAQTHSTLSQPNMLQQPRKTLAYIFEGRRKNQKPTVFRKNTLFEDRPWTGTDMHRNSSLPNGTIQRATTVELDGPGVPAQRLNRLSSALPLRRSTSTVPNLPLSYASAFREGQMRPVERFIVLDLICCACCRQPRANEYSNLIENHRLARIVTLVAVLTILGLVLTYIIRSAIEPAAPPDPFGSETSLANATASHDFLPRM